MEEDCKISKIEYLSNHWSDPPQILTFTSGEQAKIKMLEIKTIFNGIWPLMEEDLKKSKIKYLSNHRSDLPQTLKLSSGEQTKIKIAWYEDIL